MILTHRAVQADPTLRIHILSPRVREESRVANLDCCEITREEVSIPGNIFACQPVRQNPDDFYNDSRNLATSSRRNRRGGKGKSDSGEPVQAMLIPCCQEREREQEKRSRQWRLSNVDDT